MKTAITVQAFVNAPIEVVWRCWTTPNDITKWNNASPDWHTPHASNDLKAGGNFSYRMEAKDKSMGFDFAGVYDKVVHGKEIAYTMGDGRKVSVIFSVENGKVKVVETFEPESENSLELQRSGWQAILDSFKKYVEENQSL